MGKDADWPSTKSKQALAAFCALGGVSNGKAERLIAFWSVTVGQIYYSPTMIGRRLDLLQ
jgi:hypothetical protein